jgi:3-deoxy-manno-octulosonate cytidylyltransferase (CMP-KDO synthetase)
MIQRVYERVSQSSRLDEILIATDDQRILEAVNGFGGRAVMTSSTHLSGSDRIAEAVRDLDYELVVNVQGDEPLVEPADIDEAVSLATDNPGAIATLRQPISDRGSVLDPNVVKVVTDLRGFALYFSRSPIPWPGSEGAPLPAGLYFKHVGLYVYPREKLVALSALPPTTVEIQESLEQLRALAHGVPIRVGETERPSIAVDTEADLERVRDIVGAALSPSAGRPGARARSERAPMKERVPAAVRSEPASGGQPPERSRQRSRSAQREATGRGGGAPRH